MDTMEGLKENIYLLETIFVRGALGKIIEKRGDSIIVFHLKLFSIWCAVEGEF